MGGVSYDKSNEWRLKAKSYLENIETDYKVTAINPNDYYNFKEVKHKTEKEIIRFDLHKVRTSNLILVSLEGDSIGTSMETMLAHELNIPIVGFCGERDINTVHPWIIECCCRVETSLDKALEYIKDYYLK